MSEKTYTLRGNCTNCGHDQTVTVEFGKEKPRSVECSECGCYTLKPQNRLFDIYSVSRQEKIIDAVRGSLGCPHEKKENQNAE